MNLMEKESKHSMGIVPKRENTVLVVVDLQEKFLPVIDNMDLVIDNSIKLIKSFHIMKIPSIVTEQYSKGLGKTVDSVRKELEDYKPIEKVCFDCYSEKEFVTKVKKFKNLVVCGIESHVCVTQTVLSALNSGQNVYLIADAVSSRKKTDTEIALRRLEKEGVKLATTEMIIFQLLGKAGTAEFKQILKIIK